MLLLRMQWQLLGLKAPVFLWLVSICLIAYSFYVHRTHHKASRNRQREVALAEERLTPLRDEASDRPNEGISRSLYNSIASVFDDLPLFHATWHAIASCILVTDRDKEGRLWVSEDIDRIVADTNTIDHAGYRTALFLILGVGLLATFLAILVALPDVRLVQNGVQGLGLLVQGLPGKFLSSVVALACAFLLIQAKKGLYRPYLDARLSAALKSVLPRLVLAQIMSDLRTDMATQARMFGAFDADVKGAVKEGLGESVGSAVEALERMTSLQDELNRFVRENEAQKQKEMNEQLKTALQDFGQSLGESLDRMGSKFDEALALNTHGQFVQISESLSNAATHLQQVNEQLVANQYVLVDLIELARATTATETEARIFQTGRLTNTVSELMVKLQEKTAEIMTSVDTTLTAVTLNISDKVTELAEQARATTVAETEARNAQTEYLTKTIGELMAKLQEKTAEAMASVDTTLAKVTANISDEVIELVDLARATTAAETEARKAQTEYLTKTVSELMANLQEKTAEAMTSVDTTLAANTLNISDKVMKLSTEMATVIRETSERSTKNAKEVIDQASSVSSQSATHLAKLLETHGAELTRVEKLKDVLDDTIKGFITSIDKYGLLTDGLQQVTARVNGGLASLGQTATSIKEGQEAAARVSASLSDQVESMKGVIQNHGEVWDRIRESMVEYERIFGAVEGHAAEMLDQIARHLETYSDATETHFSNLAQSADSLVSQATGRLSGSVKELSEQLEDLHVVLGSLARVSQADS